MGSSYEHKLHLNKLLFSFLYSFKLPIHFTRYDLHFSLIIYKITSPHLTKPLRAQWHIYKMLK